MGSYDHRLLRPSSAGAVRNYDDKTPFLSPIARIGRNFDEDERKPLDGVLDLRRTISDESIHALPFRTELKPDYSLTGKLPGRQFSPPASQLSTSSASSYAGRVAESTHVGVNSRNYGRFAEADNVGVKSSNLGGKLAIVGWLLLGHTRMLGELGRRHQALLSHCLAYHPVRMLPQS